MSKSPIEAGIYTMPAEEYHADPCEAPALSASLAKIIWGKSLRHAWFNSPRLNPDFERKEKTAFDVGTVCHSLVLEGDDSKIFVVDAADWRTKAAKEAKAEAYAAGLVPLLPKQAEQVHAMYSEALDFIGKTEASGAFSDGTSEQSMFALWNGTWLRGRTDLMSEDRRIILDYKTVGQSAQPESFARTTLFNLGHDIQAAMYRLLNSLTGGPEESAFMWLCQETEAPYACSLVGASPSIIEVGEAKLMRCIELWGQAVKSGFWPGYDVRTAYPEAPPWELARIHEVIE